MRMCVCVSVCVRAYLYTDACKDQWIVVCVRDCVIFLLIDFHRHAPKQLICNIHARSSARLRIPIFSHEIFTHVNDLDIGKTCIRNEGMLMRSLLEYFFSFTYSNFSLYILQHFSKPVFIISLFYLVLPTITYYELLITFGLFPLSPLELLFTAILNGNVSYRVPNRRVCLEEWHRLHSIKFAYLFR